MIAQNPKTKYEVFFFPVPRFSPQGKTIFQSHGVARIKPGFSWLTLGYEADITTLLRCSLEKLESWLAV